MSIDYFFLTFICTLSLFTYIWFPIRDQTCHFLLICLFRVCNCQCHLLLFQNLSPLKRSSRKDLVTSIFLVSSFLPFTLFLIKLLSLSTINIWGQIITCWFYFTSFCFVLFAYYFFERGEVVCSMHCKMFSRIPGLYPPDDNSNCSEL